VIAARDNEGYFTPEEYFAWEEQQYGKYPPAWLILVVSASSILKISSRNVLPVINPPPKSAKVRNSRSHPWILVVSGCWLVNCYSLLTYLANAD
jgi:hypothetical protein